MNKPYLLGVMVGLLAACGESSDSVPVAVPLHHARIDLEIGEVDGPDVYVFGAVSGVTMDARGRIYVADAQADEVRAYDPNGSFAQLVARRGGGPGEVVTPCCLTIDPRGNLWVRDTGNARYNYYALTDTVAVYRGTLLITHGSASYWVTPSFDENGRLVDIANLGGRLTRYHLAPDGAVVQTDVIEPPPSDSIGEYIIHRTRGEARLTVYIHQPHRPRHLVAHAPGGGWAEAVSSQYRVRWIAAGDTTMIERAIVAPELSARERSEAQAELEDQTRRWQVSRTEAPIDIPDRKPPLAALKVITSDRLWVLLSVPDGASRRADVFDRTGLHEMTIEWPSDVALRDGFVGRGVALGVHRDSLDVQRVVRLRFDEPS